VILSLSSLSVVVKVDPNLNSLTKSPQKFVKPRLIKAYVDTVSLMVKFYANVFSVPANISMSGTAGVIYTFVVVQASMIVRGTDSVFDTVYEIAGAPIRVAMMLIV
jgi:hypothetical protein